MSVEALAVKLAEYEIVGALPKVMVPVLFTGRSRKMRGVRVLANRFGCKILEDAS